MKPTLALILLFSLAGCATTLDRVIAACQGEVLKVDHDVSDYRTHLRFECRE